MLHARRWIAAASLVITTLLPDAALSETCLSPYIKALSAPEKVMYVWVLPATADTTAPDYLSVIDANLASATYGQILRKVEVGSAGNEAHHVGYTDDRTRIWAAALNTSRLCERSDEPAPRTHDRGCAQAHAALRPAYAIRDSRPHADQHGFRP
jgi:56kDa selenium binding protein (SBP56)